MGHRGVAAHRVALIVAALVILAASGCTDRTTGDAAHGDVDQAIEQALELAREGDSDPAQIEALEEALVQGEVTYDQVLRAEDAMISCWEQAGLSVTNGGVELVRGLDHRILSYTSDGQLTAEQASDIATSCQVDHVLYLSGAYYQQASSTEALYARIEEQRLGIAACLADQGVDDAESMSTGELVEANASQLYDSLESNRTPVDCLEENGTDWL